MVDDYIPSTVTSIQESELDIGSSMVSQDSNGKVSHYLCGIRNVDYVLAGVIDEPEDGSYGDRTSYASLYNCSTQYFQREEFETSIGDRIDPLVENLKKIIKSRIRVN